MTLEENKEHIRRYSNGLWGMVRVEHIDKMIDQIFDEHEAQLKAKDKEIERLKADCELNGLRMFRQGVNSQKKADIGWLKARSIVAMLFWEWRKSEARIYATNIKWNTGRAFQSQILFEAAYKILKEQQ